MKIRIMLILSLFGCVLLAMVGQTAVAAGETAVDELPAARGYARMVYDRSEKTVYLFGGFSEMGWAMDLLDVWALDMKGSPRHWSWEKIAELESLDFDALALDAQSGQVIVYNPFGATGEETWAFALDTYTWTMMQPAVTPPARWGGRMAYDAESDRIILSGGTDLYAGDSFADTWAYDFETDTWTDMQPVGAPAHHYADMVYHARADKIVLYGGMIEDDFVVTEMLGDTWTYDYNSNTWTQLSPVNAPPARGYHTMAYDFTTGRIIMYGGVFSEENWPDEPTTNELWVFNLQRNRWKMQTPVPNPGERAWHQMVGARLGVLMFGGGPSRMAYQNDTWLYSHRARRWFEIK